MTEITTSLAISRILLGTPSALSGLFPVDGGRQTHSGLQVSPVCAQRREDA